MTDSTKHSPTPWTCSDAPDGSGIPFLLRVEGRGNLACGHPICSMMDVTRRVKELNVINAPFIVRAVNSHAALVGALQDLLKSHEGMHYERGCDESSNRIAAEDTAEFMANDPTVRAAREALKNAGEK